MNKRLAWTTWPTWVFYGWHWYPDTQRYLMGDYNDEMAIRVWVEIARQKANGASDGER